MTSASGEHVDDFIENFDKTSDIDEKFQMFYAREDVQDFIKENLGAILNCL